MVHIFVGHLSCIFSSKMSAEYACSRVVQLLLRRLASDGSTQCDLGKKSKWVHLAKIGLEKYFLLKMKRGVSEPFFEKAILNAMGINKLEKPA